MKKLKDIIPKNINIKWKLTLWAAFLMLFLFLSYNVLQYFVIQSWTMNQEEETIQKKMEEVTAYMQDTLFENGISDSEHYLEVLNDEDQLIRVVREDGSPVFTVSDDDSDSLVAPKNVTEDELVKLKQDDESLLIYREPIEVDGFKGTVEIVRDLENFESLFEQIGMLVIITGSVAIVLSFIGGRLLSTQLLKPINAMIGTMKKVKEKGLKERVPIKQKRDEMTELGMMFNELMDTLEKAFQQQQQFVEDASHELKTPLSVIHGHLSLIKRWGKDDPEVLERSIGLSLNETDRLIHLVSELLTLSRGQESSSIIENNKVKPMIDAVIENYQMVNNEFDIASNLDIEPDFTLNMMRSHFEQIMIIVLDNAIKYSEGKKVIQVDAWEADNQLIIEVTDFGVGIKKEELPLIFNRFYRVDKSRSRKNGGNGLGLSIAARLVEMYNGTIEMDSEYGKWTKVKITFPGSGVEE